MKAFGRRVFPRALVKPLSFLVLSSCLIVLSAYFGQYFVELGQFSGLRETGFVGSFAAWDGEHYARIAREGHSFDPERQSNVAFFPAFPLLGRIIATITGLPADVSLLVVAHAFLFLSFTLAAIYIDKPSLSQWLTEASDGNASTFVLLALAFFPTTFYFRMAYSESMFLFEVVLVLYGIQQRWSIWLLAGVVGLATATRAAGIAMLLPLWWSVWDRGETVRNSLLKSVLVIPLATWGLIAFMTFQYLAFDDPLAFARTQQHWDERPPIPFFERLWLELTLEPFWCEYDPSCVCNQKHASSDVWYLNMFLANPIYLAFFAALLAFGAVKGWLTRAELLMGAALLLFSYLTKSYATCMASQARFASTVFPAYLVMGRLLQAMPAPVIGIIVAIFTFFLASYSALFVRWHCLY
jgi:hypothetical protein